MWSITKIQSEYTDAMTKRGRIGVDRQNIINRLNELIEQCKMHDSNQARLTCISALVAYYFDLSMKKQTGMSRVRWNQCKDLILDLLNTLSENKDKFCMSRYADMQLVFDKEDDNQNENENDEHNENLKQQRLFLMALNGENIDDLENLDKNKNSEDASNRDALDNVALMGSMSESGQTLDPKYCWINGNLWNYICQLSKQLHINLKSLHPRTPEYKQRQGDTRQMIEVLRLAFDYYRLLNDKTTQVNIYTEIMSLTYCNYRPKLDELNNYKEKDDELIFVERPKNTEIPFGGKPILTLPNCEMVHLAKFIFKYGDKKNQTKAMLYLIFNMALHNRYQLCHDLLLMSHLAGNDTIGKTNVELQILYNRTVAQYAIAAFAQGQWYQTMTILKELYSNGKIEILLGQGVTKLRNEPTMEQEKQALLQQQRLLPSHLHISLDLLDSAHLISSLFIEIPKLVISQSKLSNDTLFGNKNKIMKNKYFKRKWDGYVKREMRVPPENTEAIILATGVLLMDGKYNECKKLILKLNIWNELVHSKYILNNVMNTLKRECMKCYLFRFGGNYESLSIKRLSKKFSLTEIECKEHLRKMIVCGSDSGTDHDDDCEKLRASLDEINNCLFIYQSSAIASKLQRLALEYGNRLALFTEQNERLLGGSNYGNRNNNRKAKKLSV